MLYHRFIPSSNTSKIINTDGKKNRGLALKILTICLYGICCSFISTLLAEDLWHRKALKTLPPPNVSDESKLQQKLHLASNHKESSEIDHELALYFSKTDNKRKDQNIGDFTFLNSKHLSVQEHVVRKGETLWGIARKYKTTPQAILKRNPSLKRRQLYIGEKLLLGIEEKAIDRESKPKPKPSKLKSNKIRYHKIEKGDTLYSIAKKYKLSLSQLKGLNHIHDPRKIRIGQVIKIGQRITRFTEYRRVKMFNWPLKGTITSRFGIRVNPFQYSKLSYHKGIDIAAKMNTPFRATRKGSVILSKYLGSYGNCIFILHSNKYVSVYAHNKRNLVKKGQIVKTGEIIGLVGNTGSATGPHLHFEIRNMDKPVDPIQALRITQLKKKTKFANES